MTRWEWHKIRIAKLSISILEWFLVALASSLIIAPALLLTIYILTINQE